MNSNQEVSILTKKKLAKLFIHTGESEMNIEMARQALCKMKGFEPYAAFQRIDRAGKGYLTPRDLLNYTK